MRAFHLKNLTMPKSPPSSLTSLTHHEQVKRAFAFFHQSATRFTEEHIRICEIPAPPFKEQSRGEYFATRFAELNLANVHTDSIGNVIGYYPGQTETPLLVVSAHLDTVFPETTEVTVQRRGARLFAPGIGDNCAGLAALLAMIEALNAAAVGLRGTIAFVATVGEEGEGNLRGARHLFTEGHLAGRITDFISFDGPGIEFITHQALGSRRYRVTLNGPGGHSWSDFGVVNPIYALGRIAAKLSEYAPPNAPRTTYNIGRIEGGDSVNVIPEVAHMDVDLRSTDEIELSRLEEFFLNETTKAIRAENALRAASGHSLRSDIQLIGHRPSGELSARSPLVRFAIEASQTVGIHPVLNCASTDANIPISLGIPAITIGAGGIGGDAHRLTEWYEPMGREIGYQRALLLILSTVGILQP
ncbi:MAG: M20/M25/M40 family metallo-hydrolase [Acidobacteria bacterium]|nr:M20/M25/M40 family metallo-hydrolase [Acidobacteriota bacterium]